MGRINEAKVREVAGVFNTATTNSNVAGGVTITERCRTIKIEMGSVAYPPCLTIDEARKLARQLYRIARRIEARTPVISETPEAL